MSSITVTSGGGGSGAPEEVEVTNFPDQQEVTQGTNPWVIDGTATVDGEVSIDGTVVVTGPLTDAELRAVPVPVSGTVAATLSEPISVDDNGGSLTVDGTVELGSTTLTALETITIGTALPSGTNNIGDVDVLTLPSIPAGTNNIGDVDVLSLPAIPAGNNNIGDVDVASIAAGDNNIGNVDIVTVPAPLNVVGGGTEAAALRVTIANNSTGVLSVDDNGSSLTVDGSVSLAAAIPAGTNNIGDVDVLTLPALPVGNNNIGDVDIASVPAPLNVVGGGTEAAALRVTIANNSTGVLSVDDNGSSLTVDGTVTASPPLAATATLSNVAASTSSVTGLSANSARLGFIIFNDSTAICYAKFGTTASVTSYTALIPDGGYYECPFSYTGRVDLIWDLALGSARITELT